MRQTRRWENPVQGDVATLVESSAETDGERTVFELEVAPGGGYVLHYHRTYSERFRVRSGELSVEVDGIERVLGPGEEAVAPVDTPHRWRNVGRDRAVADVELQPGHRGFEAALRIAYGLARDGRVLKDGTPRNPVYLALLLELAEMRLPGARGVAAAPLRLIAAIARRRGVLRELDARYASSVRFTSRQARVPECSSPRDNRSHGRACGHCSPVRDRVPMRGPSLRPGASGCWGRWRSTD